MSTPSTRIDPVLARRAGDFAGLARANVLREYPNAPQHLLAGPEELVAPRTHHPAFYGAYDWHSSVHMHWLLARLLRRYGDAFSGPDDRTATIATLDAHLTPEALAAEADYLRRHPSFERPYGWAWLLALTSEISALASEHRSLEISALASERRSPESTAHTPDHRSPESTAHASEHRPLESTALPPEHRSPESTAHTPDHRSPESTAHAAEQWFAALRPATEAVAELTHGWLRKATYPVRHGTHVNSAFALGLMLDSAEGAGVPELLDPVTAKIREWYVPDHGAASRWEPSGQDFLSPVLSEADAVRRVLPPVEFGDWLAEFLPELEAPGVEFMPPPRISDPADPQIGHLFGLCLSRAAALRALAGALPETDPRAGVLAASAEANLGAALPATTSGDFTTDHWLATFATLALDGGVSSA